jgi:chorismate synthase
MSSFGNLYKITTFGESHSKNVGVVIDSPISNINLNIDYIQKQLNRRRPGQSKITTSRNELDTISILSGLENNITLGTPLTIIVNNLDTKPEDYIFDKDNYIPRPSHADYTYLFKYNIHAASGGGRSSARETIGRVISGAIADQILDKYNIKIFAFVEQIGDIKLPSDFNYDNLNRDIIDQYITRCPDSIISKKMEDFILILKSQGDSIGGIIKCIIKNCPSGLGEPVFDKLEAVLAHAMMSIPASKAFEIGSGFNCVNQLGSQHNDLWYYNKKTNKPYTITNSNGGIIGGISNGMDITFRIAFKPPATILKSQVTSNIKGQLVELKCTGRHDPCILPRAIPIVESMSSIVILNMLLYQNSKNI